MQETVTFAADWEAQLKSNIPGYGGLFVQDGTVNVWVKGEADQEAVKAAVAEALGPDAAESQIVVRGATYTLAELEQWQALDWLSIQGVNSIGVAQMENRLSIGVETEAAREQVMGAIDRLGVPAEAVTVEVIGEVHTMTAPGAETLPADAATPGLPDAEAADLAATSGPAAAQATTTRDDSGNGGGVNPALLGGLGIGAGLLALAGVIFRKRLAVR